MTQTTAQLRNLAIEARAANDPNRAADAWRSLLDQMPDDWALALELKHDLKAGLHYPDSDARFRRAARNLPDAEWLAHYSTLYAFHGSDLDAIDARALSLLADAPLEPRLHAIRGDVARQRRDWATAATSFAEASRLLPDQIHHRHRAALARLYARLSQRPWPATGPHYKTYVVNLDRNAERMVELDRHFAHSPAPRQRIPGVEGARLPAAAVHRLTGDPAAPRGTLGCFLSHAAAWEALVASGDDCALIIEDDVIPLLDLPRTLGGLPLPASWDIVFINDRLEPRRDPDAEDGFTLHSLTSAIQAFHPDENAPGGDGYLLSRHGAEALLAWTARDGFSDDVDWRMLTYSMDAEAIAGVPAICHARRELDRLQVRIPRTARLDAHVLNPSLIRSVGVSSDREDENRKHPA